MSELQWFGWPTFDPIHNSSWRCCQRWLLLSIRFWIFLAFWDAWFCFDFVCSLESLFCRCRWGTTLPAMAARALAWYVSRLPRMWQRGPHGDLCRFAGNEGIFRWGSRHSERFIWRICLRSGSGRGREQRRTNRCQHPELAWYRHRRFAWWCCARLDCRTESWTVQRWSRWKRETPPSKSIPGSTAKHRRREPREHRPQADCDGTVISGVRYRSQQRGKGIRVQRFAAGWQFPQQSSNIRRVRRSMSTMSVGQLWKRVLFCKTANRWRLQNSAVVRCL